MNKKHHTAETPVTRRQCLRRGVSLFAVTGAALVLSACGQKGPLYIPGPDGKKKKKKSS